MTKRDKVYDYIRCMATLLIILCHLFQTRYRYTVSSWLNIGVQVFLVLSAKLLSKKEVMTRGQILAFYKTRLLRIYLPVWLYLLCLVPVLFAIGRGPTPSAIALYAAGLAGFAPSGVLGLGHFWYITVMLLCYLLVPILNHIDDAARKMRFLKGFLLKAIPAAVVILVFAMTPLAYFGVNIALFIVAYFCFRTMGDDPNWSRKLTLCLLPFAVAAIGARLYLEGLPEPNVYLRELGTTAAKAVLGMFLFALLHFVFSRLGDTPVSRGVFWLSNVSYEVYIVHQFILLALYEYVPLFRREDALSGLALLAAALLLIVGNTAILYIVKNKITSGLQKRVAR